MHYKFKTKPFAHQLKALEMSWDKKVFAYFMEKRVAMTDDAIFEDVSKTIKNALQRVHDQNPDPRNISATAFEIALKQLI